MELWEHARSPGIMKKKMFIREDAVFAALDEFMSGVRWSEIFAEQVQKLAKEVLREEKKFLNSSTDMLHDEIKKGGARKEKLLGLHLDGGIDRPTFLAQKLAIERDIQAQENLLARHRRGDAAFERKVTDLVRVFTEIPDRYFKAARHKKAQWLRLFVARVIADNAKNVTLELREPYALFVGPAIEAAAALPSKKAVRAHPVIWRRRELNPRPTVRTAGHYMLSRRLVK